MYYVQVLKKKGEDMDKVLQPCLFQHYWCCLELQAMDTTPVVWQGIAQVWSEQTQAF